MLTGKHIRTFGVVRYEESKKVGARVTLGRGNRGTYLLKYMDLSALYEVKRATEKYPFHIGDVFKFKNGGREYEIARIAYVNDEITEIRYTEVKTGTSYLVKVDKDGYESKLELVRTSEFKNPLESAIVKRFDKDTRAAVDCVVRSELSLDESNDIKITRGVPEEFIGQIELIEKDCGPSVMNKGRNMYSKNLEKLNGFEEENAEQSVYSELVVKVNIIDAVMKSKVLDSLELGKEALIDNMKICSSGELVLNVRRGAVTRLDKAE